MKHLFIFSSLVLIFSCNDSDTSETKKDSTAAAHTQVEAQDSSSATSNPRANDVVGCYWKVLQRDTFALHLEQLNNKVSGKLTFNNFQKDKSSGVVDGRIDGDVIKLWYRFQSEGMNSVMEVYFKKEGDGLIRGLGDMEVKGDSAYFRPNAKIAYTKDQTFSKVDCGQLPGKYQ